MRKARLSSMRGQAATVLSPYHTELLNVASVAEVTPPPSTQNREQNRIETARKRCTSLGQQPACNPVHTLGVQAATLCKVRLSPGSRLQSYVSQVTHAAIMKQLES